MLRGRVAHPSRSFRHRSRWAPVLREGSAVAARIQKRKTDRVSSLLPAYVKLVAPLNRAMWMTTRLRLTNQGWNGDAEEVIDCVVVGGGPGGLTTGLPVPVFHKLRDLRRMRWCGRLM